MSMSERRPQSFSDVVTMFEKVSDALYDSMNMTREEQILAMQGACERIREKAAEEEARTKGILNSIEQFKHHVSK